jgi:NADH-quinone oxidoreductase subunit L
VFGGASTRLRRWQTGFVRSYALSMLAGVVVLLAAVAVIS